VPTNNASGPVVYLANELSASSWVVACRQPMNEKIKMHRMEAGDCEALLALICDQGRNAVALALVRRVIPDFTESPCAGASRAFRSRGTSLLQDQLPRSSNALRHARRPIPAHSAQEPNPISLAST
jgi:hypothetical protein